MKHLLPTVIILISFNLTAQRTGLDFNYGPLLSLNYTNDLYGDGGGGIKAEAGGVTRFKTGSRRRGRIGVGATVLLNNSNNTYTDVVTRLGALRFDQDTSFALRSGSLRTKFLAIAIPLEYRFVSDGRVPWSVGITYRPGLMIRQSGENDYTEYDLLFASGQRVNETPRTTEETIIRPNTLAFSLNFGYETERHSYRFTVGRDYWQNDDDFIVEEYRWLMGVEFVKWLRKR